MCTSWTHPVYQPKNDGMILISIINIRRREVNMRLSYKFPIYEVKI